MSDSLQPHRLKHARLPCPSPTPGACSNSCPSSWWCHPTISSSVIPFSSCLQSFPALGSFPMSQFFPSGGQSIGVSASALVLPINMESCFPLRLASWSPCSPRDSQESSPTPQFKSINCSTVFVLICNEQNPCCLNLNKCHLEVISNLWERIRLWVHRAWISVCSKSPYKVTFKQYLFIIWLHWVFAALWVIFHCCGAWL